MQKSNFEKQVRDQLEELHFRPSAPVWDHIANNIRRRRRRRVLAYFSILAVLLTGAGFAYLYRGEPARHPDSVVQTQSPLAKNNSPITRQRESVPLENNSISTDQAPAADRSTIGADSPEESRNQRSAEELIAPGYSTGEERVSGSIREQQVSRSSGEQRVSPPSGEKPVSGSTGEQRESCSTGEQPVSGSSDMPTINRSSDAGQRQNAASASADLLPLNSRAETDDRKKNLAADHAAVQPRDSGNVALNDNVEYDNINDIISADHLSGLSAASLQTHQDSAKLAVHENTSTDQWKKRSWEWGIEMGAGAGYRRNQSLPGVDAAKAAQADLTTGSPLQTGRLTNSLSVLRYFPSKSNEGFGWSIGLTARKEIASHVRFSAGLRYNYQSDRILIGEMQSVQGAFPSYVGVTGTGSPVYLGPQNQTFTNRYHLIQLPVGLEVQLNKGVKTPISWEAGLAPGYLLATQARVYDKAYYGIYYEDKSQFQRLQMAATTGFSVELRNKHQHRLVLGPELRLSLTPLADNAYDNQQYLLYGGLRARLYLP